MITDPLLAGPGPTSEAASASGCDSPRRRRIPRLPSHPAPSTGLPRRTPGPGGHLGPTRRSHRSMASRTWRLAAAQSLLASFLSSKRPASAATAWASGSRARRLGALGRSSTARAPALAASVSLSCPASTRRDRDNSSNRVGSQRWSGSRASASEAGHLLSSPARRSASSRERVSSRQADRRTAASLAGGLSRGGRRGAS
jgi:hypothetical protein